tara:strand:- start:134 stop:1375 length:1242 start_codon:yes stop_codon:yes gene_type:complete
MKNHIINSLLTLILLSSSVKAADFFVYSSAQAPDYSTIQSAVNAASNNDNIYIDSTVFAENVTIDKSLSFYPLNKGSRYTINGGLTLDFLNNTSIYIQGLDGAGISSTFNGSNSDSATIIINDCSFTGVVDLNQNSSIHSFIYYSEFDAYVEFDHAELIGNDFNNQVRVSINQDVVNNPPKVKIYANSFYLFNSSNNIFHQLEIDFAENADIHIANNVFNGYNNHGDNIRIMASSGIYTNKVLIENNTIYKSSSSTSVYAKQNINIYYCDYLTVRNNYFNNQNSDRRIQCAYVGVRNIESNVCNLTYDFTNCLSNTCGSIISQNNIQSNPLSYNSSTGVVTSASDGGADIYECRDIDNTINDIGTYGGPHSWSNYHNNSNSPSQIIDLEIPYYMLVLPGTILEFNSKAIHKNE